MRMSKVTQDQWLAQALQQLNVVSESLMQEMESVRGDLCTLKEDCTMIDKTIKWILGDYNKRLSELPEEDQLTTLILKSDLIRKFTQIWVLYREGWKQRKPILRPLMHYSLEVIEVADEVVRSLLQDKDGTYYFDNLNFEERNKGLPIVVPFMTDIYAAGFSSPTPVIVAHYLGDKQVWPWLSYAHEVGHHIYRGVKGLRDEIRTKVMLKLLEDYTVNYNMLAIWFNWLEELFADIFGLLQLGPQFDRAQLRMLLHLPSEVIQRVKGKSGVDPREGLMQGTDLTHPVPYLRSLIAFNVLQELKMYDDEMERTERAWENFVQNNNAVDTNTIKVLIRNSNYMLEFENREVNTMLKIADKVIKVILNSKFYTLAANDNLDTPRNMKTVFGWESLDKRKEKIASARKAIQKQSNGNEYEIRHLLAAAQDELEDLPEHGSIEELSKKVFDAIVKKLKEKETMFTQNAEKYEIQQLLATAQERIEIWQEHIPPENIQIDQFNRFKSNLNVMMQQFNPRQ